MSHIDTTPLSTLTSTSRVCGAIRADVIHGAFAPGQRLKIAELAKRYSVSAIPVREALAQLEAEGLVQMSAHKGAIIRSIDARFVSNMYDLRSAIETMLIVRAARSIRREALMSLTATLDLYEAAGAKGDTMAMLSANRDFHRQINLAGDNEDAVRLLDQGWELIHALRHKFGYGPGRWQQISEDHRAVVAALEARDEAQAMALSDRHCAAARDDLLRQMANQ